MQEKFTIKHGQTFQELNCQRRQIPGDDNRWRAAYEVGKGNEENEMETQFDIAQSNILNFHDIRPVLIAIPKTEGSKKPQMCKLNKILEVMEIEF